MKSALLIIDVQNAMVHVDQPVFRANETIKSIQNVIMKARTSNIPVIYIQHNEAGSDFEYGKETWKIAFEVNPKDEDIIIHKIFSDAFKETNLKQVLETLMIKDLIVVGMQTDYCINATSLRAVELGYNVTIIKDAHSTWDDNDLSAREIIEKHHIMWSNHIDLCEEKDFQL